MLVEITKCEATLGFNLEWIEDLKITEDEWTLIGMEDVGRLGILLGEGKVKVGNSELIDYYMIFLCETYEYAIAVKTEFEVL
jgi:hypothetical protein